MTAPRAPARPRAARDPGCAQARRRRRGEPQDAGAVQLPRLLSAAAGRSHPRAGGGATGSRARGTK